METPITKLLAHPWAIYAPLFEAGVEAYKARLFGGEGPEPTLRVRGAGVEAIVDEALAGGAQAEAERPYEVIDGTAIIPVDGILTKRPMSLGLCEPMTAGTANLMSWFEDAVTDPQVKDIILYIDSPGGSVDGTQVFGDAIFNARGLKPVTAYVDGLGASAAMWLAAQADRIVAASPTTIVGSIGVVATHIDTSKQEEADGVKVTEITAGKWKRAYSSHKPLDEEGAAVIQARVDGVYAEFINSIARARGVDAEKVDAEWGQGREFMAKEALAVGLIDAIMPFKQLFSALRASEGLTATIVPTEDMTMTETQEALASAVEGAVQPVVAASQEDAVANERARIQGIFAAVIPGHEALASKLAFEQHATVEEAKDAFLAAERARLDAEAPPAVPTAAVDADPLRARWDASASVRNLYNNDYEAYRAANESLTAAVADGRARTMTK